MQELVKMLPNEMIDEILSKFDEKKYLSRKYYRQEREETLEERWHAKLEEMFYMQNLYEEELAPGVVSMGYVFGKWYMEVEHDIWYDGFVVRDGFNGGVVPIKL